MTFLSQNNNQNRNNFNCNFNVNIAEINDKDIQENNPQLFWRFHQKNFSKSLPCEVIFREINEYDQNDIQNYLNSAPSLPPTTNNHNNNNNKNLYQNGDQNTVTFPTGHILDLMIKNVSKDSKLTPQEFEVIITFIIVIFIVFLLTFHVTFFSIAIGIKIYSNSHDKGTMEYMVILCKRGKKEKKRFNESNT